MLLFFCAQPSYVLKMKQRSRKSLRESYVCLFVVNGLDICCGMMTRLLGQFFSFSSFSLFFCTASHMHTALICYFAVNKRFSSDVCVALDLCVSSYTYVAYIVESANFWDNIEQKNDFFSMLLMWWNVRNVYGTFIILDFLCACIQFVSIFSSYLMLFHIPAAFFRLPRQKQASVFKWFHVFWIWEWWCGGRVWDKLT